MLTKKDLRNIGELMDERLDPVKDDMKRVETKVDSVKETLDDLVDATGAIFAWTDDIHREIVGKPAKRVSGN